MCLLTLSLPNAAPNYDELYVASINNPDGFGFAVHTGDDLLVVRSMDPDWIIDKYQQARTDYHDRPSIFHLRLATHGAVDLTNCHPFYTDASKNTVLAHNGVLPIDVPKGETRSDTRLFAEDIFPHVGMARLNSRKSRRKLRKRIGSYNKIALLTTDPESNADWRIINESAGHWKRGTWYSNDSYMYRYITRYSRMTTPAVDDEGWPEEAGDASTGIDGDDYIYDTCYNCSSQLTEDELTIFGYCETCGSCVMCGETSGHCMCFHAPEYEAKHNDRYSYTTSFYQEVLL